MSLLHRVYALTLAVALGGAPGDRPAPAPGAGAPPHAAGSGPAMAGAAAHVPEAFRRFMLFGWVSPPVAFQNEARYAEMAGAGLNLALSAWADSGRVEDNLARLDLAAAQGMKCIVLDERFSPFVDDTLDPASAAGGALIDTILSAYRGHPAFLGLNLGDEPPVEKWPRLERLFAALRQHDPEHPAWNNLLGRLAFADRASWERYTRDYLARFQPAVLCNDHYEFMLSGDRGQFVENVAGLSAMAREAGVPFWAIVLLVQHLDYRAVTEGELRWQVSLLLAYGARGIGYFTYWTPAPDPELDWHPAVITYDGRRTPWYPVLADFNRRVRPAGETLASLDWISSTHAGGTPPGGLPFVPDSLLAAVEGRAAIGQFADSLGTRYLLVANRDSLSSGRVRLTFSRAVHLARQDGPDGSWSALSTADHPLAPRVEIVLAPGDFTLLRARTVEPRPGAAGPGITIRPEPSRGEVTLEIGAAVGPVHVQIVDISGRNIWSVDLASGGLSYVWRGEQVTGHVLRPGTYVLRARDLRGVSVRNFHWLGSH